MVVDVDDGDDPGRLALWLDRGLLFLGLGLTLSGVVFFFAYNWEGMHRLLKLSMIEAGIIGALITALISGLSGLRGKLALLVASVLVGVFLAVYGQIYQTGADAWQLFAGWAGLIAAWTLLSRLQALWGLWLVVGHVALALLYEQLLSPQYDLPAHVMALAVAALDTGLLGARELWLARGARWLEPLWGRRTLAVVATTLASGPGFYYLITGDGWTGPGLVSVVGWALLLAPIAVMMRRMARDIAALAIPGLSLVAMGLALLAYPLYESLEEWSLLLLGLYVIVAVGLLVLGLKRRIEDDEEVDHG